MMKKVCILVLLIALLLTACSQQKAKETESTKDTAAPTAKIIAETEEVTIDYYALIEEETVVLPTVSDDIDYYEMLLEEGEKWEKNPTSRGPDHGYQYAKEWVSTDGRISFTLDTRCGPFDRTSPEATYTVDGETYQTRAEFNILSDQYFQMELSTGKYYTHIISGPFEYDHDEQSFIVTVDSDILYSSSRYDLNLSKDEFNAKYGDPDVPYYHEGEKVTFKMVR